MSSRTETDTEPSAGSVIADQYELLALLGEGGMSSVWRAKRRDDGAEVALKVIARALAADRQWRRRFEREAKLLSRLAQSSEHIVRVLDYGISDASGPYLAMELLNGESLADRLESRARLTPAEVVTIVDELSQALDAAHEAGVIHRDIKPANLFMEAADGERAERLKLLDFGVAKVYVDSELTAPTRAGTVLGTPQYMSPEQFMGDTALDARSDLWSVGVLTYRMLVGHAPFSRGPAAELAARVLGHDPPPPSTLQPTLPQTFDVWMKRALAKRPEARFARAGAMATALAQALAPVSQKTVDRGRYVKGVNLIDLVKLLKVERRAGRLADLSDEDATLIDQRVLVSSWYPIETFWRLVEIAHTRVLGGTDDAAIELGRRGAHNVLGSVHSVFVKSTDLRHALRVIERGWSSYFDFGTIRATVEPGLVTFAIYGYPDVPRIHGLTTLGWFSETLSRIGVKPLKARISRAPWEGSEELVYEFEIERDA